MQIASVTNQPEVQEGRFRKRNVRASFPGTTLRQAIRLMTDLESAQYPIAIERVHIEHYQEGDHYNLELGVITYDRSGGDRDAGAGGGDRPTAVRPVSGGAVRAGPPSPP
jgi:hypothetical protein